MLLNHLTLLHGAKPHTLMLFNLEDSVSSHLTRRIREIAFKPRLSGETQDAAAVTAVEPGFAVCADDVVRMKESQKASAPKTWIDQTPE